MSNHTARGTRILTRLACGASLAAMAVSPAWAQDAIDDAPAGEDEIVVTGFRASLDKALGQKRESVSAIDAIVAEDIAKFPDQNLAESLQRIPGISIQRDGGEGRAVTVRGLGPLYTRVRVNGLETITTTTDGGSANRDRAFDFNVFASELFTSLVVHKTAEASLDEGSLGAVIDLNTGNPLGGKSGFTGVLSAQGSYNDLSKNVGPRVAGLLSWRNDAGTFGASLSAAYQHTKNLEVGNNTVRWGQAYFNSVNGTNCFYSVPGATGGTPVNYSGTNYRPSADCDAAATSFHPRIPRYGESLKDRERLGFTASLQFAPTDATRISIDGLYSRFKETRDDQTAEILARSNEKFIDVVNPVYDDNNNMIAATWNNAYMRTEHYQRKLDTEFYQLGASWDQDLGDTFRFTLLGGFSKSDADIPQETTIMFDNRGFDGFSFDYTNPNFPTLSYAGDTTDPANYQLSELRDAPSNNTNRFKTLQLRTEWDVADGFQVKTGAMWRRYNFDLVAMNRNTAVCPAAGPDVVLGTITCTVSPSQNAGPGAVYGFPVTSALGQIWTLPRAGQPSGNTNQFLVADLDAATAFTKLYSRPLVNDNGNIRGVQETTKGGYIQFDGKGDLAGLRYALNAGIRYVKTEQSSYGINSGQMVTVDRSYDDWLPSVNLALYPTERLIVRGAVSKVVNRPSLGDLTPGGNASGFAQTVNFGNPFLKPIRATAFDASIEWYFRPESVLSIAFFKKDIESFPIRQSIQGTFASTGLPASVLSPSDPLALQPSLQQTQLLTIQTNVNGEGATLKGMEISLQTPFTFLPGLLSNFGMQANATFVDSDADFTISGGATSACFRATPTSQCSLRATSAVYNSTLLNLSKKAFSGTLYYDDGRFSARTSITYRGPFLDGTSGNSNVFEGYKSSFNVDASIRYQLTENIELSIEGTNLTDDYRTRFVDFEAQRPYENNHFGRTINFGARFKI